MRSAKVTANAFRAGFHRMVHRACPVPLGSIPRVTRYSVLRAACSVGLLAVLDAVQASRGEAGQRGATPARTSP